MDTYNTGRLFVHRVFNGTELRRRAAVAFHHMTLCGQPIRTPQSSHKHQYVTEVWRAGVQCCWSRSLEQPFWRQTSAQRRSICTAFFKTWLKAFFAKFYNISGQAFSLLSSDNRTVRHHISSHQVSGQYTARTSGLQNFGC